MAAGEVCTTATLDDEVSVRDAVLSIGFDSFIDDMCRVDSKDLSHQTFEVGRVRKLSPDIAGDVHVCQGEI